MSDPIEIGGKGTSPGPKIVKRMSQLELSTADLYTKRTDIYDSKLLPEVKEAVNQLSFPIPDDKKRFIKEVGKVKEKGTDDELDSAKKVLTTKQAGLKQPTVGGAVVVAVPIVAKLATVAISAIVSAAVTYDLAKQVDGLVKNARGDKDKKKDKGVSGGNTSNNGEDPKLPKNRKIDEKVMKVLKKMGLDKKFRKANELGLAARREGTSGIIKLTASEFIRKAGKVYTYKLKVPTAGGHTRVYGYINELGELIFDLIVKK